MRPGTRESRRLPARVPGPACPPRSRMRPAHGRLPRCATRAGVLGTSPARLPLADEVGTLGDCARHRVSPSFFPLDGAMARRGATGSTEHGLTCLAVRCPVSESRARAFGAHPALGPAESPLVCVRRHRARLAALGEAPGQGDWRRAAATRASWCHARGQAAMLLPGQRYGGESGLWMGRHELGEPRDWRRPVGDRAAKWESGGTGGSAGRARPP